MILIPLNLNDCVCWQNSSRYERQIACAVRETCLAGADSDRLCFVRCFRRRPARCSRAPQESSGCLRASRRRWTERARTGSPTASSRGPRTEAKGSPVAPPPLAASVGRVPRAAHYFRRRLCLWMPQKMWEFDLKCPRCPDQ